MPIFSAKASNLHLFGPILDVRLQPTRQAIDSLQKLGQKIPNPVTVSAMIDTGATSSVIQTGIPKLIGLNPVGIQMVNTPTSQNVQCYTYAIGMVFPSTAGIKVPITIDMVMIEHPCKVSTSNVFSGATFCVTECSSTPVRTRCSRLASDLVPVPIQFPATIARESGRDADGPSA